MTCIVGLADGRNVWMGGDSCAAAGSSAETRRHPKVFRKSKFGQPDILLGYTDSFRMGQALQYGWSVPEIPARKEGTNLTAWMCTDFIDSVRERLGEAGFKKTDNGVERGGMFMVGLSGRLFTIDSDFQVGEVLECYHAIGCGGDLALGSMYASGTTSLHMKPAEHIELALSAAAQWSAYVRAPFHVEILKGDG